LLEGGLPICGGGFEEKFLQNKYFFPQNCVISGDKNEKNTANTDFRII
jgi:hypothetical protein